MFKKFTAFTLAEVLITLGIIGVVAAMTIPTLMNKTQDREFKTAYKKAYSDLSQAFAQAINEQSLTPRSALVDNTATASEWAVIKSAFNTTKDCPIPQLYECWTNAEKVYTNSPAPASANSFIDAAGRSWSQFTISENIYLVDTNGLKSPNQFGKDRWIFTLWNADNTRTSSGLPVKVAPYYNGDVNFTGSGICDNLPCYYKSWLYN